MKPRNSSVLERSRLPEWVGLGALTVFTAMAVIGYWAFGPTWSTTP